MVLGQDYGKSVDVYSYAMILFELYTEKTPFEDEPNKVMIHLKVCNDPDFRPVIPDDVIPSRNPFISNSQEHYLELMQNCWQHQPSKRPDFPTIIYNLKDMLASIEKIREN